MALQKDLLTERLKVLTLGMPLPALLSAIVEDINATLRNAADLEYSAGFAAGYGEGYTDGTDFGE